MGSRINLGEQDRAYLIGVIYPSRHKLDAQDSLLELQSLTKTSGALEVGLTLADVRKITPGTFLGKGKILKIKEELDLCSANLVIFDGELSPSQNRNLEEILEVRVIDRTSLILDIFALHAKSKEGKLQVELAQYQYLYPRLVGAWTHLSKQRGGGVGLRGPGETQLEVDRRRVREKIIQTKKNLEKVSKARRMHHEKRASVPIPIITLVGYTNAGKSTLFNSLTHSNQLVEDKLFATLDPKTSNIKLPSGREVLITDTVGFIRNLPHQLVEAFKSTFEEVSHSDLLIHVLDISDENSSELERVVEKVLEELGLNSIPSICVMNKIDVKDVSLKSNDPRKIFVSAKEGKYIDDLLYMLDQTLSKEYSTMHLFLPHPYGQLLSNLYTHGRVLRIKNKIMGAEVEVALPEKWMRKYAQFSI